MRWPAGDDLISVSRDQDIRRLRNAGAQNGTALTAKLPLTPRAVPGPARSTSPDAPGYRLEHRLHGRRHRYRPLTSRPFVHVSLSIRRPWLQINCTLVGARPSASACPFQQQRSRPLGCSSVSARRRPPHANPSRAPTEALTVRLPRRARTDSAAALFPIPASPPKCRGSDAHCRARGTHPGVELSR
jgi:hypothetical protein